MRIIIGSDHMGYTLKEDLIQYLVNQGHEPVDVGCENATTAVDYPDVATSLAERIAEGEFQRGILICGTGIGMAIAANKVPGIRAATCHDVYSAQRARKSNDAQIITLGAQIVAPTLAHVLIDNWLASEYEGGRSIPKVEKLKALDNKYRKDDLDYRAESQ
jgi:ribose 5-phosphate isomerase B